MLYGNVTLFKNPQRERKNTDGVKKKKKCESRVYAETKKTIPDRTSTT